LKGEGAESDRLNCGLRKMVGRLVAIAARSWPHGVLRLVAVWCELFCANSPLYQIMNSGNLNEGFEAIGKRPGSVSFCRMVRDLRIIVSLNPFIAVGVFVSTATTDAVYVLFNAAVSDRRRVRGRPGAPSGICCQRSRSLVSYTHNAVYVLFAAAGSWIGAFSAVTWLIHDYRPTEPSLISREAGRANRRRPDNICVFESRHCK
jgi:hypothetical protein